VSFALLEATAAALDVGARLELRKVTRGGIAASKVDVITPESRALDLAASDAAHAHTHQAHTHAGHSHQAHTHAGHADQGHADGTDTPSSPSHAPHRSLSTILAIIQSAALPETVKARSIRAFQLLGEAEAAIHSIPVEKVHFHEVGAVDTIVDIVCSAVGCESLGVDRWLASSVNFGSGTVKCQHG